MLAWNERLSAGEPHCMVEVFVSTTEEPHSMVEVMAQMYLIDNVVMLCVLSQFLSVPMLCGAT